MNICRNVVDPSITGDDNKRDHMVRLDNTQVIGGEDKANRRDIKRAAVELRSEHRGANAALYGRLGYLILIATAGNSCQVSAMELVETAEPVTLILEFEVRPGVNLQILTSMAGTYCASHFVRDCGGPGLTCCPAWGG